MPIQHEGAEYYSKAEVEEKMKERVRNVQGELDALTTKWKAAEPELAKVTTLAQERDAERARATRIETRYTAATQFGITDDDTLEALEAAHTKAMGKVPEAQRVDIKTYLGQLKADPSLAPTYLRSVFAGGAQGGAQGAGEGAGQGAGAAGAGAQGGQGAGGGQGGQGPQRPAWASASATQQRVEPGNTPSWAEKAKGAKSLAELQALNAERKRR